MMLKQMLKHKAGVPAVCASLTPQTQHRQRQRRGLHVGRRRTLRCSAQAANLETRSASSTAGDAEGPVCVVTGASRGIGKAIAIALGSSGARVLVNYASSAAKAEEVAHEIASSGGEAIVYGGDMSSADDVQGMFKACTDKFGRCDVLVAARATVYRLHSTCQNQMDSSPTTFASWRLLDICAAIRRCCAPWTTARRWRVPPHPPRPCRASSTGTRHR